MSSLKLHCHTISVVVFMFFIPEQTRMVVNESTLARMHTISRCSVGYVNNNLLCAFMQASSHLLSYMSAQE